MSALTDRRSSNPPSSIVATAASATTYRGDLVQGYDQFYGHGSQVDYSRPVMIVPPVISSAFQTRVVQLYDYFVNGFLYRSGQIGKGQMRNTGATFRVPNSPLVGAVQQVGSSQMGAARRYTKVQQITRYDSSPSYYDTKSGVYPAARLGRGNRPGRIPGT